MCADSLGHRRRSGGCRGCIVGCQCRGGGCGGSGRCAAGDSAAAGDRRSVAARGATTARIVVSTFARRRLDSARGGWRVRTLTAWSGQAQTLLVLDAASQNGRDWVKVLLASRPNGSAGWVPRDHVELGKTRYWIEIRTRTRQVTVYRSGTRVRRMRAVVGAPATPTPHVLAAVYEINRQPNPRAFLGPWVLSLTALSNVLENFGGGPGRVGIHGRAGASFNDPLGSARSHGCIRVDNHHISWMAGRVPAGTPVRMMGLTSSAGAATFRVARQAVVGNRLPLGCVCDELSI